MMVGRERRRVEVGYVGYKVEMNLVDRYGMAAHSEGGPEGGIHQKPRPIQNRQDYSRGPKMTAFHIMMLSALGDPLIPTGGSVDSRRKSRIRRRLAAVDWASAG
jgi:hypothetical protein